MALKTVISPDEQGFKKTSVGNLLFGAQIGHTFKLLAISEAVAGFSAGSITSIVAVKINSRGNEISRTSLATNLISFNVETNEYLTVSSKHLSTELDECLYFIEFTNGSDLYLTDYFLVQKMTVEFTADTGLITADSSIKNNVSHITA